MRTSLSFLGCSSEQIPMPGQYGNEAVEAVLFHRGQLADKPWQANWQNIDTTVNQYGSDNVVFHFPMNGSDYVDDHFVYERLVESYQRAVDLNLSGVIVHSNRIRSVTEWRLFDQKAERTRIGDILSNIRDSNPSSTTWLGIENMPSVGNSGYETDPLYTAPDDFTELPQNIGIVWDVCHAMCSSQYTEAHQNGDLPDELFLRPDATDFSEIEILGKRIVHWHFASSKGLNLPKKETTCTEGMNPDEGDMPEPLYRNQLERMKAISGFAAVNFEVQEVDYMDRVRGPAIISWAKSIIES